MPAGTPSIPRNKRWSAVSASANADVAYQKFLKEKPNVYEYVCICKRPGADDDDEDEDEDEDDAEDDAEDGDNNEAECDGGKTCRCFKPAADYPDHPWIFSRAGLDKMITYRIMLDLRDPDSFSMYTFNDHSGYGAIEVVQNMMLDFEEASGKWQQQWAVIEALAWLLSGDFLSPMVMIDDGDLFQETSILLEQMFLAMLAELEKEGQLEAHSDVHNIGLIMGLIASKANNLRSDGFIHINRSKAKSYHGQNFIPYLLAYASKGNITMRGPSNIDEIIAEGEELSEQENVELPTAQKDPWKWGTAFKAYKRNAVAPYGGRPRTAIGGDRLDITTYSSAERKRASFTKKDPLTADMIKSIKEGLVLQLA
ncbi:hypothetical protein BDV36DRAFT_286322 [Aspergillus pseudocaelatus]|uniref:Uncharacterized protein n=1 Tax=Aspergillus pseudocaelatus TaxID=1825620 RepID=A0ABQ6WAX2_9EURO|nr:hypothetical protein BDV36DRAFT_286322 [Aspergillus pseudocaelatus]